MTVINYSKPLSFPEAVEATAVLLQHCLTRLRDESEHREGDDPAPLHAAYFLIALLEDTLATASDLSTALERRLADPLKDGR